MSDININLAAGESKRLLTAGKYCPSDVLVTAESGGGYVPPETTLLDPDEVYRTTRPSSWLPLPTPNDYECFCLGHILKGLKGYFAATITYNGTCVVEYGTLSNGEFVAKESFTPTSGTIFSKALNYSDYGDELEDGTRQYIVRIYGTDIRSIDFRKHTISIPRVHVVDIVSGIASNFTAGDHNNKRSGLESLRYLRFVGNGRPNLLSGKFVAGCPSLMSVSMVNEIPYNSGHWGAGDYAFFETPSLIAVSPLGFSELTTATHMFRASTLPRLRTNAKLTSFDTTFGYSRLTVFDKNTFDTTNAANMYGCFSYCSCLREVTGLNITSLTISTNMFLQCYNLSRLVFAGETTPGGYTIDLKDTTLGHDALVEMIASLPTATKAATITITNNPGASELTADEIAVATAKNWTITI